MTRAALIANCADEIKRKFVLKIERIGIDVRHRRFRQCAVDLNSSISRSACSRIDPDCKRRICRVTERRTAAAQRVKNLPADERRAKVSRRGAAADRVASEERRIATRVGKDYFRDAVVVDAGAATNDEFVFEVISLWAVGK